MARRPITSEPIPEADDATEHLELKKGNKTLHGGPRKVNKSQLRSAIKKASGVRIRMAELLGVGKATITRCFQRWPDLTAIEKQAWDIENRSQAEFAVSKRKKALIEEQPWAIRDVLRDHGHHVGIQRRTEVTGIDGQPIQHQHAQITLHLTQDSIELFSADVCERLLSGDPAIVDAIAHQGHIAGEPEAHSSETGEAKTRSH